MVESLHLSLTITVEAISDSVIYNDSSNPFLSYLGRLLAKVTSLRDGSNRKYDKSALIGISASGLCDPDSSPRTDRRCISHFRPAYNPLPLPHPTS